MPPPPQCPRPGWCVLSRSGGPETLCAGGDTWHEAELCAQGHRCPVHTVTPWAQRLSWPTAISGKAQPHAFLPVLLVTCAGQPQGRGLGWPEPGQVPESSRPGVTPESSGTRPAQAPSVGRGSISRHEPMVVRVRAGVSTLLLSGPVDMPLSRW